MPNRRHSSTGRSRGGDSPKRNPFPPPFTCHRGAGNETNRDTIRAEGAQTTELLESIVERMEVTRLARAYHELPGLQKEFEDAMGELTGTSEGRTVALWP